MEEPGPLTERSSRQLKFAILEILVHPQVKTANKYNLIGRPYQRGTVELHMDVTFTPEERVRTDRSFEEIKLAGLVRPTYGDLSRPGEWVEITDAGRRALERHALDDLDAALMQVGVDLVEMRDGAWIDLHTGLPDSLRHAAHSARELVDQTLARAAPEGEIRKQPWFQPVNTSHSGVTRRHRLRLISQEFGGQTSGSDLDVAEAAHDLLLAINRKLQGQSHARSQPTTSEVEDALRSAETALRMILVRS